MTEEETAKITKLARALDAAESALKYYASLDRSRENVVKLEIARTNRDIAQQELTDAREKIVQRRTKAS